jgi:hypothetical protein
MMKASEARTKVETIKNAEIADLKQRAISLCECYGTDEISNAVAVGKTEVTIFHVPTKLKPYIIEILKTNGYEAEETDYENDIKVRW